MQINRVLILNADSSSPYLDSLRSALEAAGYVVLSTDENEGPYITIALIDQEFLDDQQLVDRFNAAMERDSLLVASVLPEDINSQLESAGLVSTRGTQGGSLDTLSMHLNRAGYHFDDYPVLQQDGYKQIQEYLDDIVQDYRGPEVAYRGGNSGSEPETNRGGGGSPPPPPPPPKTTDRTVKDTEGEVDKVQFGLFTEDVVRPGSSFMIDVWAFLKSQFEEVKEMAEDLGRGKMLDKHFGVKIVRGTVLTVQLSIEGMEIDDPTNFIEWDGDAAKASFIIDVPADASGRHKGAAHILAEGIVLVKIPFLIKVTADEAADVEKQEIKVSLPKSAFASYSSKNRDAVMQRLSALRLAIPSMDIFFDRDTLKTSRPWEEQLFDEIPKREKFYLFWSKEAAGSEWVEKEWRCALDTRGIENIQPMPLDDPRIAPPPPELGATLHFYDPMLAQIAYEKMINKQLGRE